MKKQYFNLAKETQEDSVELLLNDCHEILAAIEHKINAIEKQQSKIIEDIAKLKLATGVN